MWPGYDGEETRAQIDRPAQRACQLLREGGEAGGGQEVKRRVHWSL